MNILTFLSTAADFDEDGLSSESLCESSLYATSPIIELGEQDSRRSQTMREPLTTHIRCWWFQFKMMVSTPPICNVLSPSLSIGPMSV
jgi:hypothetical protein